MKPLDDSSFFPPVVIKVYLKKCRLKTKTISRLTKPGKNKTNRGSVFPQLAHECQKAERELLRTADKAIFLGPPLEVKSREALDLILNVVMKKAGSLRPQRIAYSADSFAAVEFSSPNNQDKNLNLIGQDAKFVLDGQSHSIVASEFGSPETTSGNVWFITTEAYQTPHMVVAGIKKRLKQLNTVSKVCSVDNFGVPCRLYIAVFEGPAPQWKGNS